MNGQRHYTGCGVRDVHFAVLNRDMRLTSIGTRSTFASFGNFLAGPDRKISHGFPDFFPAGNRSGLGLNVHLAAHKSKTPEHLRGGVSCYPHLLPQLPLYPLKGP